MSKLTDLIKKYCSKTTALLPAELKELQDCIYDVTTDVNEADFFGNSPLILAVKYKLIDVVRMLLNRDDLKVNATDSDNKTACYLAASTEYGNTDILKMLVEFPGTNVNTFSEGIGECTLFAALCAGNLDRVRLLLQADATIYDPYFDVDLFNPTLTYILAQIKKFDDAITNCDKDPTETQLLELRKICNSLKNEHKDVPIPPSLYIKASYLFMERSDFVIDSFQCDLKSAEFNEDTGLLNLSISYNKGLGTTADAKKALFYRKRSFAFLSKASGASRILKYLKLANPIHYSANLTVAAIEIHTATESNISVKYGYCLSALKAAIKSEGCKLDPVITHCIDHFSVTKNFLIGIEVVSTILALHRIAMSENDNPTTENLEAAMTCLELLCWNLNHDHRILAHKALEHIYQHKQIPLVQSSIRRSMYHKRTAYSMRLGIEKEYKTLSDGLDCLFQNKRMRARQLLSGIKNELCQLISEPCIAYLDETTVTTNPSNAIQFQMSTVAARKKGSKAYWNFYQHFRFQKKDYSVDSFYVEQAVLLDPTDKVAQKELIVLQFLQNHQIFQKNKNPKVDEVAALIDQCQDAISNATTPQNTETLIKLKAVQLELQILKKQLEINNQFKSIEAKVNVTEQKQTANPNNPTVLANAVSEYASIIRTLIPLEHKDAPKLIERCAANLEMMKDKIIGTFEQQRLDTLALAKRKKLISAEPKQESTSTAIPAQTITIGPASATGVATTFTPSQLTDRSDALTPSLKLHNCTPL